LIRPLDGLDLAGISQPVRTRLPAASEAGSVAELIEELERRYVKRLPPQHDDAWMIDQEIRFLMSCAL
jgi:hypothetical protein